ncbi:hypothetical protein HPB52_012850 [Rhipicephalus sanguineus]|uniref:Lipoxygenase domain-containing protein n=1 Tax=Rhipicephalus sanguineus TaxID=34632 RepID=A0A9D4SUF5_RHISA|nr:hypothetical protein HPB52_012850 [Rhipicephalus sanguineus]
MTSQNQARVTINTNHLKVELLDLATKTWSVHVNLEKATELWWERLLVNEPKINIRAIDPTKPFEDLDPES